MSSDVWASGAAYEPYVGRWSRLVAARFLRWLDPPSGGRWLDIGCGTGALTETVLRDRAPDEMVGVDPSEGFVAYARGHITDPRARFELGTAAQLPLVDSAVDVAVSGLVLNFVPDAAAAVAEVARVLRPGATYGAYVWDYAEGMQLMRWFWDVAAELDPPAGALDEGPRFPLCRPDPLRALLGAGGFTDIAVTAIEVPTRFADFADYWTPFLGGQGPAPAYAMSLSSPQRDALREALHSALPSDVDGSISLTARAWAVRGTTPQPGQER